MFSLVGQHLVENSNIDQGLEPPVIVVLIKIETKIEYNKIKSTRNYIDGYLSQNCQQLR